MVCTFCEQPYAIYKKIPIESIIELSNKKRQYEKGKNKNDNLRDSTQKKQKTN